MFWGWHKARGTHTPKHQCPYAAVRCTETTATLPPQTSEWQAEQVAPLDMVDKDCWGVNYQPGLGLPTNRFRADQ